MIRKKGENTMKLRNIYVICRDNYKAIEQISAQTVTISGRTGKRVSGWNAGREALLHVQDVSSLRKNVESIIDSVPSFFIMKDSFDIESSEWNQLSARQNTLLLAMNTIIDLYESMGMDKDMDEKAGLDIKLPPYNDFSEFTGYVKDLEFVLTKCPFFNINEEQLKFSNVDVGSSWLTFFVVAGVAVAGGSVLLNNIAAFMDKCIILRSHYLTTQKQKQDLQSEKKAIEHKEAILSYIESIYQKEVDQAIQEMEEITGYNVKNRDGDEKARIEMCFSKMGDLIDKGLQIYSTIDSPKETKELFKPLEMKYISADDELKLLTKKEE